MPRVADICGASAQVEDSAHACGLPEASSCAVWLQQPDGDPGEDGSSITWGIEVFAALRGGERMFVGSTQTSPPTSWEAVNLDGGADRLRRPRARIVAVARCPGAIGWHAIVIPQPQRANPDPGRLSLAMARVGLSLGADGGAGPMFEHEPVRVRRTNRLAGTGTYAVRPGVRLLGWVAVGGVGGAVLNVSAKRNFPIALAINVAEGEVLQVSYPELPEPCISRPMPDTTGDLTLDYTNLEQLLVHLGVC